MALKCTGDVVEFAPPPPDESCEPTEKQCPVIRPFPSPTASAIKAKFANKPQQKLTLYWGKQTCHGQNTIPRRSKVKGDLQPGSAVVVAGSERARGRFWGKCSYCFFMSLTQTCRAATHRNSRAVRPLKAPSGTAVRALLYRFLWCQEGKVTSGGETRHQPRNRHLLPHMVKYDV